MPIDPRRTLNINNFLSEVSKSGLSRLNRIAISIRGNGPQQVVNALKHKNKDNYLTYYAESVLMPGHELLTNDLYYAGPRVNIPVRGEYKDIVVTFLVDDNMRQKEFFDAWMNYINPKQYSFDFRYRDDYVGEIDIYQISEDGSSITYGVRLYEVFPISMGEIKGTWAEQEAVRLDVSFSYRYWRSFSAPRYEKIVPGEFLDVIDVIGETKDSNVLGSIDVIGETRRDRLRSIDVVGET